MKFATQFTEVQKALGIEVQGFREQSFQDADAANADRIQHLTKGPIEAVLVDGKFAVCKVNGVTRELNEATEAQARQFLGI